MKMFFRHVFLNIIRIPARTVLCFIIAFFTVTVTVICGQVNAVISEASENFRENYPAVATVSSRVSETATGVGIGSGSTGLDLNEMMRYLATETVEAYNITLNVGSLAEAEIIKRLPTNELLEEEPKNVISAEVTASVMAVNNINLTEPFYSEDSVIVEGREFSAEEMRGGTRAMIISKETAEKYSIRVGDSAIYKYRGNGHIYSEYTVVGIYESARGITYAYIPLGDYMREFALSNSGSYIKANDRNFLLDRADFLLRSPSDAEKFITDAIANGTDPTMISINVNDKPYKSISEGLNNINTVTLAVLISVIFVGVTVFFLVAFFFSISRKQERIILRALGMKNYAVTAMFVCELTFIAAFASAFGILVGVAATDTAIELIESGTVSGVVEEANKRVDVENIQQKRRLTMQRDVEITLSEGYTGLTGYIHPARGFSWYRNDISLRYELVYMGNIPVTVTGTTWLDSEGFENKASYDRSIIVGGRSKNLEFACYVPEDSSYKVGDVFLVDTTDISKYSRLTSSSLGSGYSQTTSKGGFAFKVVGTYKATKDINGIVMAMEEMELCYDYATMAGETFSTERCDKILKGAKK